MAVAMLLESPGQTPRTVRATDEAGGAGSGHPDGGLFHVAGPMPSGWRVVARPRALTLGTKRAKAMRAFSSMLTAGCLRG
jgi:hypothetical protein